MAIADRQKLWKEEIEAVMKAIAIISTQVVKGNTAKHLPQLVQTKFLNQARAANYLEDKAQKLDSRLPSALAILVEADSFKKVKKMIKDLIVKPLEKDRRSRRRRRTRSTPTRC